MPNHIQNELTLHGPPELVKNLLDSIRGEKESKIDFKKIIPRPAYISDEENMLTQEKEGIRNWYYWQIESWGTKWNAYESSLDGNTLRFQTAWAFPEPVVRILSSHFPEVSIEVKFADEDYGSNLGHLVYEGGKVKAEIPVTDPVKWAAALHGQSDWEPEGEDD